MHRYMARREDIKLLEAEGVLRVANVPYQVEDLFRVYRIRDTVLEVSRGVWTGPPE